MDATCPCCAPPWEIELLRLSGFCTLKSYDFTGNLLWIGDQKSDSVTGVAVDSSGNVYTSLARGYDGTTYADYNLIEKRDSNGGLIASVAVDKLSAPEIGVGHFKTTRAEGIAVNTDGVYIIYTTIGDNASFGDRYIYKYNFSLTFLSILPVSNASVNYSTILDFSRVVASGNTVVATIPLSTGNYVVPIWISDALNNISSPERAGTLSGLETDGTSIYTSVSSTSSNSFVTWDTTGAIVTSVGGAAVQSMGINGASVFGAYPGITPITGLVQKGTGNRFGANSTSYYAKGNGGNPTILSLYNPSDVLQWSANWMTGALDTINEIVVISNRVYAVGKRLQMP